ncbi:MAG: redoxin domain-containing protein [Candidatus Eisenbacteria bacterium]|nr:redoxin domain-containing protein [Candidatus Eisenbacteria bacterium]
MQQRFLLVFLAVVVLFAACSRPEPLPFSCSPPKPKARDTITIRYRPDLSDPRLARADSVLLRFALVGEWGELCSNVLPMKKRGNEWRVSFHPTELLPVDPILLVSAFLDSDDPDLYDNNQDDPWIVPFYRGGHPAPGFHYQVFRLRARETRLPDILGLPGDHAKIVESIEADLAMNPDHLPARAASWMAPLHEAGYGSEEYNALRQPIRARLDSLFSELILRGDPDSLAASFIPLFDLIDMDGGADSLVSRLRERFPDSRLVTLAELEAAKIQDDDSIRIRRLEEFVRAHPEDRLVTQARDLLVRWLVYLREPDKLIGMMDSGVPLEPSELRYLAWALFNSGRTADAERVMRRCIEEAEKETRPDESPYSVDEWTKIHEHDRAIYLWTLAWFLSENENYQDAFALLDRAVSTVPNAVDPGLLAALAECQENLGRDEEALRTYDRVAEMEDPDPETLDKWRAVYSDVHGSTERFEEHLADLAAARRSKDLARLDRVALRWPAPDVTIRDLEGNVHSLAEFRGKVVLVDFWATWCGPCMQALPHLDTLFREWEPSGNFAILPVNTWERCSPEERLQRIQGKWNELGLSLPVYLDVETDEKSSPSAAAQFKVRGIPATFILDRDGNILFKDSGFGGKKTMDEIRLKIEFAMSRGAPGA